MARKSDKLKAGKDNFDDGMDMNMEDFDFGTEPKKSRSPAAATFTGIKNAARDHFTNESTIRRYVGKALPAEYGEAFDTYTDSRDKVKDAVSDVKKTLRQPVNDFSKAVRDKLPQGMKRSRKFLDYLVESTDEYKGQKYDKAKEEDNAITASIEQLFSAQEQKRTDDAAVEKARGDIEKTAELIRFKSQINALNSIARSSDILAKQAQGMTVAYQKKSLELQYRTVFALRDLVEEQKLSTAQNRTQLDAIRHNTGLPETQKLQLNERFKDNMKNKFVDKAYGAISGGGKNIISGMVDQFGKSIKELASDVSMALSMSAMGLSMDMDLDFEEEDPAVKKRRKLAEKITTGALSFFEDGIGDKAKKMLKGNRKVNRAVKRGASHLKNVTRNGDSMLKEFAFNGKHDDNFLVTALRDLAGMAIPGRENDRKINHGHSMDDIKGPAVYNGAAQRSITEVMPGYLARILQELQIARTGNADVGLVHFDKGKFISKNDLVAKYAKELNKGGGNTKASLDKLFEEVNKAGGGKLSSGAGTMMGASLLKARTSGGVVTPDAMMRKSYWEQTRSKADAGPLAEAFKAYFDSKEGKFSNSNKALKARDSFLDKMTSAQENLHDPRADIQDAYTKGHGDIMEEMGWTSNKDDSPEINTDRIIDNALGRAKSDFFAKDSIKKLDPKVILNKLKKLGVSKWKYKPSESKDQSEKVGPMAQDVNKQFGNETAPGGKKIDLVSMNGIALGAIKGLQDRIDNELGDMKGQGNLEKLVYINTKMYGLLSHIAEHGGMGGGQGNGKQTENQGESNSFGDQVKHHWGEGVNKAKGFWNRTMGENTTEFMHGIGRRAKKLGIKARRGVRAGVAGVKAGASAAHDQMQKSRLLGARKFQDFKDGLPEMGDVFFGSEDTARISKARMAAGMYRDAKGNVLNTIASLADCASDIFDAETGETVASQAEMAKAYVKSNFEVFTKVFADRVKRAASRLKKGVVGAFDIGNKLRIAISNKVGTAGKFAKNLGMELLMPPRDVYVKGETVPRLLAQSMRLGAYVNAVDGSVITRPMLIKGAVKDLEGNVLISDVDLTKGLCDVDGNPFKGITQRLAEGIRKRAGEMIAGAKFVAGAAKGALKGVKTFLTKGMSGFAGGEGGLGGGKTLSVLEQIRDLLDARLPGGTGAAAGALSTFMGPPKPQAQNSNLPKGSAVTTKTNRDYDGGTNIFDVAGKAISGGIGAVKGFFSKGKKGASSSDNEDIKAEVKAGQEKLAKDQKKAQQGQNKTISKLKAALAGAKAKTAAGVPAVAGAAGVPAVRANSWQEQQANRVNSNLPTKSIEDVEKPGDLGTKNTFDLIADFMAKRAENAKDALGAGKDLLDNLPDRDPKKGGRTRTRQGPRGKMPKVPAKAATAAAESVLEKAAGAQAGKVAGKQVLKAGAKWGAKRIAVGLLGGIAGILGSPVVGIAIGVGGALWGAKEIYDMYNADKPKKAPGSKPGMLLENLRMAEYGVGGEDPVPLSILMWLEEYLYPSVKVSDGSASIDEKKVDAEEIVKRFGLDVKDNDQMARFSRWLENRFKPNFLKWSCAGKAAKIEKFSEINTMKASNQLAFFKAVTYEGVGWDELSNPFGATRDLAMDSSRVSEIKNVVGKALEEKAKEDAPLEAAAKTMSNSDMKRKEVGNMLDGVKAQTQGGEAAGKASFDAGMKTVKQHDQIRNMQGRGDNTNSLEGLTVGALSYKTGSVEALPSKSLTALASLRYRLYGLTTMDPVKVAALSATEATAQKFTTVNKDGSTEFSGKAEMIVGKIKHLFGISTPAEIANWLGWFQNRFLPTYSLFVGQALTRSGVSALDQAVGMLTPQQAYAIGTALTSSGKVMSLATSPWPDYVLASDNKELQPFLDILKERADGQALQEEKIKPTAGREPAKTSFAGPGGTDTRYNIKQVGGTDAPQPTNNDRVIQAAYTLPDQEEQPRPTGAGSKPIGRLPSMGSLKTAAGELAGGSGADAFMNLGAGVNIDGLNPELLKLFRGMVEEYGQITGKSIGVNSGARSSAEQAALYNKDPSSAAKPGSSLHEFGLAVDINSADADALEKLGLMRKYGFTRPVGGEPWHIEPAGIQDAIARYKKDAGGAMHAVSYSPGKGGGGVGITKTGYAKGKRNEEFALSLQKANAETVAANDDKGGGGYAGNITSMADEVKKVAAAPTGGGSTMKPRQSYEQQQIASFGGGGTQPYASTPDAETGTRRSRPSYEMMQRKTFATQSGAQDAVNSTEGNGGSYDGLPQPGGDVASMKELVKSAAETVGVDPSLASTVVAVESSFKANAKAGTSSASGLNQFTNAKWDEMMGKHANVYKIPTSATPQDAKANALLGSVSLKKNLQLAASNGLPANALTAYLMHFLGTSGGQRFLNMPDDAVPGLMMPEAAAANKSIFFTSDGKGRTKSQIMALLQDKLTKAAAAFGITAPVGDAIRPSSAPATASASQSAPSASAPSTGQGTAYENKRSPEPVRQTARSNPPTMSSPSIMQVSQRDSVDPRVGAPSSESIALVKTINEGIVVQQQQLDIQTKIFELLVRLETKANGGTPTPPPAESFATPQAPAGVGPDRTPRRVSEPAINLRQA